MARVFLLNPPSPEPVKSPLLSFCHLAASLRAGGHEVALLDASAPFAPHDDDTIAERIAAFAPDLVGLHLKTLHVQPAYALAAHLGDRWPLVAGGPHATVCPDEPFAYGFDYVVRGEGEPILVELADALDGKLRIEDVAGLSYKGPLGRRVNPARGFILELDALAPPMAALDLFDPAWYGPPDPRVDRNAARPLPPAGILSSRGCPAACTFCSNNVTGRRFRYRSAAALGDEIRGLVQRSGLRAFSFFDDSFAVGHRRVRELCAELRSVIADVGPIHWTCTAHPAHLDLPTLLEMKSAGCGGVDIGMESGDPSMLLQIGKGVTVERVLEVLTWCRDAGLHSMLNLMFGWPDETDAQLEATIAFMDRAAPLADGFNSRGVLVPYPGTEIYDRYHERFGFTGWWLHDPPLEYHPFPSEWTEVEVKRAYASDPALARNYFGHPAHRLARIQDALDRKAEHTIGAIARRVNRAYAASSTPVSATVSAPGVARAQVAS